MQLLFCISGGWDQGNFLASPKSLATSEQSEGTQNNHEASTTLQDEPKATHKEVPVDENGVPQIILQPPSSPGTEEEDNCETTETELENRDDEDDHQEQTKLRRSAKENRRSREEKSYSAVEDKMDSRSPKKDKKEETLVDIESDEEKNGSYTPQPPIALFFKEQEDFPAPPDNTDGGSATLNKGSASHDLMFFSESDGHSKKDQECTRTSYEDDLWIPMEKPRTSSVESTGSADFPPPPSPPTIQAMECTCERITPDENRELDQATSKNALFSDTEESRTIGRPSPIVLTMAKNGPVTNAVSVKQATAGDAKSNPPSSTRSFTESTGTQSTMVPDHSRSGIQKAYSTDIRYLSSGKTEPMGTRPVSTSDMNNQNIRSLPTLKQRAGSEGWVSPKSESPPEQHRNVHNSKNNSNNSDINEFPPPPPPLSNDSGKYQADSPWVPLLERFQVDQDSAMYMDSEENHRRPRPKPGSTTQDQRSHKFRSYAPNSKPSIVEVKNSESKKDKKNETCVQIDSVAEIWKAVRYWMVINEVNKDISRVLQDAPISFLNPLSKICSQKIFEEEQKSVTGPRDYTTTQKYIRMQMYEVYEVYEDFNRRVLKPKSHINNQLGVIQFIKLLGIIMKTIYAMKLI